MSRFATPSRTRVPVVAVQPAVPVQREPGFKYEKGLTLPGPSIKGKHTFEIYVDGQRQTRPIDSRQPTSANIRDPDFTVEESQFLPLSSRKRFEKPEKEDRNARRKSPTPITSRSTTPNRVIGATTTTGPVGGAGNAGIMVNAEVVRIGSSPGRLSSNGSVAGSVMSSQSHRSIRSQSSSSLASRSVGTAKSASSYYYSLSKGSVRDRLAHSSNESVVHTVANRSITPNRLAYNQTGNSAISVSGNSQQTGRSLSSKSRLSSSLHGNHIENLSSADFNLQLSQSSYKTVRKAIVRNNLRAFLQADEEEIDVAEDKRVEGQSPMKQLVANLVQFDEADYPAAGSPSGNQSQTGGGQQLSQAKKKELKRHTKIMKMTNALRQSIHDELKQFSAASNNNNVPSSSGSVASALCLPQHIFFPTTNSHPQAFTSLVRQDIVSVIGSWQKDFLHCGVGALDGHYRNYVERLQARNSIIEQYHELGQEKQQLLDKRDMMKNEIADLIRHAEEVGVDLHALLSRYPEEWFDALQTPTGEDMHGEGVDDEVASVAEKMSTSVFLQPELMYNNHQEDEEEDAVDDEQGRRGGAGDRSASLDYEHMDSWQQQILPHSHFYHNDALRTDEEGDDDEDDEESVIPDPTRLSTGQRIQYQHLRQAHTPLYTSKLEQTPPPPPPSAQHPRGFALPSPTNPQRSPPWKVNFEVIKALSSTK